MTSQSPDDFRGLRLHLNENPYPPSPAVLAALQSITRGDLSCYPDYRAITSACERYFGVPAGWVKLVNGLDDGLFVAARWATLHPRARVVILEPAFDMYAAAAAAVGARIMRVPPGPDFAFPEKALLAAIAPDTRLVYLTDPNNPTGIGLPAGTAARVAAAAPHALILIDEAYADFSGRSLIGPTLDRHRNIVVGRTFSKAHGLAALRVGALVAHPSMLASMSPLLPPYGLNACAVRALAAALEDTAYRDWYVRQSRKSRQLLRSFAARHGYQTWASEANFVLIRIGGDVAGLVASLAGRGIAVRDRSTAPACDGCIRITAGVVDHTRRCIDALEEICAPRNR